jgi:hypothetical protein
MHKQEITTWNSDADGVPGYAWGWFGSFLNEGTTWAENFLATLQSKRVENFCEYIVSLRRCKGYLDSSGTNPRIKI